MALANEPRAAFQQSGFHQGDFQQPGFSQGGFQQVYKPTLNDINNLRSSLQNAALQITQALQVLQNSVGPQADDDQTNQNHGFQPPVEPESAPQNQGFNPDNFKQPEVFENKGFQPPEKTVDLLENDAAALKSTVGSAFASMDGANMIIGKAEFGPGFWQSGFRDTTK